MHALKRQVIQVARRLYQKGLIAGTDGNVSVLAASRGPVVITPGGLHKGFLGERDVAVVELDGTIIEEAAGPSSELPMHLEIYGACPEARAVVHAHPPWTLALGLAGHDFSRHLLAEGQMVLGEVPVVGFHPPGSAALARAVGQAAKAAKVVVMERHGAVAWDGDLEGAFCLMECLEHNARITGLARLLGALPRDT